MPVMTSNETESVTMFDPDDEAEPVPAQVHIAAANIALIDALTISGRHDYRHNDRHNLRLAIGRAQEALRRAMLELEQ